MDSAEAPQTTIITLLEENKINDQDGPGVFSLNLAEQVTLKEGDSLNVINSFIDTTTQGENFIEVGADETDITISAGIFWVDQEVPPDGNRPIWFNGSVPLANRPNAQKYILQNQSEAFLNTYFDWNASDNPSTGLGPSLDFVIQLEPLIDNQYGFQYKVIAQPQPGPTPVDVPAPGYILQSQYIIDGHMILYNTPTAFEFHYYPRGWTPASGTIGPEDHTAIFDRWVVNGVNKGWRAKRNLNHMGGIPENQEWLFQGDQNGYDYFDDGARDHIVEMTGLKMPIFSTWEPESQSAPHQFPAVKIDWIDPNGKAQSYSKEFTEYPPTYGPSPDKKAGVQDIIDFMLLGQNIKQIPDKEPAGGGDFVPANLQGKKQGWAREWQWYLWSQVQDPRAKSDPVVWPKFQFNINKPPVITYYYSTPPLPMGNVDTAFVNPQSVYYDPESNGMICSPWQMVYQPVLNPQSSGSIMTPRTYDTKFTIPQGKYTYDAFAQLLTDKINAVPRQIVGLSNNPDDPDHPVNAAGFGSSRLNPTTYELMMQYDGFNSDIPRFPNNYVFSATEQTIDGVTVPAKTAANAGVQPFWVSEDGNQLFRFDPTGMYPTGYPTAVGPPRIVGAQNFSVIFDESSQTFQIGQAHSNIYVDGPTSTAGIETPGPQVLQQIRVDIPNDDSFLGPLSIADVSSGVFITDLQPASLWFGVDKMRMNRRILTTTAVGSAIIRDFEQYSDFSGETRLASVQTHAIELKTGRNITGFYVGTDALVSKNENYQQVGARPTGPLQLWNNFIEVATPVTLPGDPILQSTDDQPYYQVEISGINSQDIHLGENVPKNNLIQAYVGKYYSAGNFTSSAEPGFNYVHKGEPLVIRSVRVRILDTQGEPEAALGIHSAVVLQLNSVK